jgi:arsenate reductase (thioredoxin)
MAEGFANHYGKGWLVANSAGTNPVGFIMSNTIQVMQEKGIDISQQRSKGLDAIELKWLDWIVILELNLGWFGPINAPRAERLNWPIPDPVGQSMDIYRQVRDQIELKVVEFLDTVRKSS